MMTQDKYQALKNSHPVFSMIDRSSGTIAHGLQIFLGTRLLWLAALVPTCVRPLPELLGLARRVLAPVGLGMALPERVSGLVGPRLLATGGCMAVTSLRQILQATYISPNANNFGTGASLLVGVG